MNDREPMTPWGPTARGLLLIGFVLACIVAGALILGWRP
jgi:hypothetical protein